MRIPASLFISKFPKLNFLSLLAGKLSFNHEDGHKRWDIYFTRRLKSTPPSLTSGKVARLIFNLACILYLAHSAPCQHPCQSVSKTVNNRRWTINKGTGVHICPSKRSTCITHADKTSHRTQALMGVKAPVTITPPIILVEHMYSCTTQKMSNCTFIRLQCVLSAKD